MSMDFPTDSRNRDLDFAAVEAPRNKLDKFLFPVI